jgi:basic membrane lipoprotein Med (substrate-binding protein (PBP1-ABC) superfamily)
MSSLREYGVDVGLFIAGLFGSLVTTSAKNQSIWQSALSVFGGAASANYLTPIVLKLARLEGETDYSFAVAFLLGFAGLRVVEKLYQKFIDEPASDHKRNS